MKKVTSWVKKMRRVPMSNLCNHLLGKAVDGSLMSYEDVFQGSYSYRDLTESFSHCPKCRAKLTVFGESHITNAPSIAFREYTVCGEEGNRTAIKVEPLCSLFRVESEDHLLFVSAPDEEEAVELAEQEGYVVEDSELICCNFTPEADIIVISDGSALTIVGEDII